MPAPPSDRGSDDPDPTFLDVASAAGSALFPRLHSSTAVNLASSSSDLLILTLTHRGCTLDAAPDGLLLSLLAASRDRLPPGPEPGHGAASHASVVLCRGIGVPARDARVLLSLRARGDAHAAPPRTWAHALRAIAAAPGGAASLARVVLLRIRNQPLVSLPANTQHLELPNLERIDVERDLPRGVGIPGLDLSWIAAPRLRSVHAKGSLLRSLPRGGAMRDLVEVDVSDCISLSPDEWIGADAAPALQRLDVSGSAVQVLPRGLTSLRRLNCAKSRYVGRDPAWLPEDAAARVEELRAQHTGLTTVPPGTANLAVLDVSGCFKLGPGGAPWLPDGGRLRVLKAAGSGVVKVPDGLTQLTELDVSRCQNLLRDPPDGWLPRSSARKLRRLDAGGSCLVRLPGDMEHLTHVSVVDCPHLDGLSWLPESSAEAVETCHAAGSALAKLPEAMRVLRELDVSRCRSLAEHFLPSSSAASVQTLIATGSALVRLPPGMASLSLLVVAFCPALAAQRFLPPSSAAALETLNASASGLTQLPPDMHVLREVDVSGCKSLAPTWLPATSAANVVSALQRLPPGMRHLRDVFARDCDDLQNDWLPEDSARELRRVTTQGSLRRIQVPETAAGTDRSATE
ncbi:unnamed protein product [Pedinophyceae sp. YPF-701]|nr:unnamed protein product [Pedinophyceae sp. YPF-701]